MKNNHIFAALLLSTTVLFTFACGQKQDAAKQPAPTTTASTGDKVVLDTFADLQILRYELPGFDKMDLRQKTFIYYLSEATLAGRDIIYDQHCKYNLAVRKTLEGIHTSFKGDRNSTDWKAFLTYSKRVWFSNGIHHHYSETKFLPEFSKAYFTQLVQNSDPAALPLQAQENADALLTRLIPVMF
ncbi:MAG: dihydrofolate reductase, partial [Saprospiraceae bacterium]